jgi:hypothetical protein
MLLLMRSLESDSEDLIDEYPDPQDQDDPDMGDIDPYRICPDCGKSVYVDVACCPKCGFSWRMKSNHLMFGGLRSGHG